MWFEKHSHRRSKVCVWNTEEQTNIKECKRNIWKEHVLPKTRVAKHSKSHLFWKGNFLIFSVIAFPKKANMAWFEYAYFSLRCNTRVWIIQKKEKGKVGATCQFSWLEMLHLHLLICWAVQCWKVFVKATHLLSLRCLDVHLASPLNCLSFFCVTAEVDSESGMDFSSTFPFSAWPSSINVPVSNFCIWRKGVCVRVGMGGWVEVQWVTFYLNASGTADICVAAWPKYLHISWVS